MLSCALYNVQACTRHSEVFLSSFQIPSTLTPEMENEKDKRNTERKKAQKKAQKQRVKVHNGNQTICWLTISLLKVDKVKIRQTAKFHSIM